MIPQRILTALAWGLRGDADIVRQYLGDHVRALRRSPPHRESSAFVQSVAEARDLEGLLGWDRCPTCRRGVPPGELCYEKECFHARQLVGKENP